jgi:hypothetical protein
MVEHTLSLMEDQQIRSDRTKLRLLRRRYRVMRAIDVQHKMPTHLKERDLLKIAELLTYDFDARRILIKAVRSKALSIEWQ